jgi:nicotinate-nucleotide adenylyltransferase
MQARIGPADELFFIIGADAFAEIRTWRRWEDVARRVRFIVVSRPGHVYEAPPGVRLERLDTIELPVSSSGIRRALAAGERPAEVPEPVLEYIFSHGLYGARVPA